MEFSTRHDYPAGLDRLWAAFGRPDYPRQKYLALGALAVSVRRFEAGDRVIEVGLERIVPLDPARLPAWARPLAGTKQTLRQRSTWHRVAPARIEARLEIVPAGLPVQAHGLGTIVEQPDGTSRMVLAWRVDSSLPLLGARVERLFAQQVRDALDGDHGFTVAFLRRLAPAP